MDQTEKHRLLTQWTDYIRTNMKGRKSQAALIGYAFRLIENGAPVIFDFTHLTILLGIEAEVLTRMVYRPDLYYYRFNVPKSSGGVREISAPHPVLLMTQRWIYENILSGVRVNKAATGFVKDSSISDNARVHAGNDWLLMMDLKDFFPSVKKKRVISTFMHFGYTKKVSYYLASLCCLNGGLPQGAPTSPVLSNIIAKRLDARLQALAARFRLKYSRYADDLAFSGDKIAGKFIGYVSSIIKDEKFEVNERKTRLIGPYGKKIITGVSISSGELKVPREKKRQVRMCVHAIKKYGIESVMRSTDRFDPILVERLLGYLAFWHSIEPDNNFVKNSVHQLRIYSNQLDG